MLLADAKREELIRDAKLLSIEKTKILESLSLVSRQGCSESVTRSQLRLSEQLKFVDSELRQKYLLLEARARAQSKDSRSKRGELTHTDLQYWKPSSVTGDFALVHLVLVSCSRSHH